MQPVGFSQRVFHNTRSILFHNTPATLLKLKTDTQKQQDDKMYNNLCIYEYKLYEQPPYKNADTNILGKHLQLFNFTQKILPCIPVSI